MCANSKLVSPTLHLIALGLHQKFCHNVVMCDLNMTTLYTFWFFPMLSLSVLYFSIKICNKNDNFDNGDFGASICDQREEEGGFQTQSLLPNFN